MAIFARQALLDTGWNHDVRITCHDGRITSIEVGVAAQDGDTRADCVVPGMANVHSHAFQRCMAGLAEMRGDSADNFWTWRETMYRFALALSPDEMETIATLLYVEMLEAGFTRVGEFHYLHHDRDGTPYGDIAEMAGRICAAAAASGIALTLLPVLYAHATFGGAPPVPRQRRFINDRDRFAALVEGCRRHMRALPGATIGIAPHSLRAVTPGELAFAATLIPGAPVHLHAAEQVKEVEDCVAWSGLRPVEWLLEHAGLDRRWCLIHATHMTDSETAAMARSGAVAGLCPITEANLGDGIFKTAEFVSAGGAFAIGTDSNILIGVADELRQLEYAQRLKHQARNVLARAGGSTGRSLFDAAVAGGRQALGTEPGALRVGSRADLVGLKLRHPMPAGSDADAILDSWIFARLATVDSVWVNGRQLVDGGRHRDRERARHAFDRVMERLSADAG